MSRNWNKSEIIHYIKQDLLLEQLGLEDDGLTLEQISDNETLLGNGNIALDSVDALDVLVNVEKTFGMKLPELSKTFIDTTCHSVQALADYILERIQHEAQYAQQH